LESYPSVGPTNNASQIHYGFSFQNPFLLGLSV
jgi:hypothetical protein